MNKLPTHRINLPKVNKTLDRGFGKVAIEIIKPWGGYPVGSVIKPPGIVRGWLIDTGKARLYEQKPVVENPKASVDEKQGKDQKQRRGRPRKLQADANQIKVDD